MRWREPLCRVTLFGSFGPLWGFEPRRRSKSFPPFPPMRAYSSTPPIRRFPPRGTGVPRHLCVRGIAFARRGVEHTWMWSTLPLGCPSQGPSFERLNFGRVNLDGGRASFVSTDDSIVCRTFRIGAHLLKRSCDVQDGRGCETRGEERCGRHQGPPGARWASVTVWRR